MLLVEAVNLVRGKFVSLQDYSMLTDRKKFVSFQDCLLIERFPTSYVI